MGKKEENSYKTIFKRISAFGGVQVFNILVNLVRGKFVAIFLGPEGMGISQLYTSSTTTLQQLAGLGLNLSMVKEIAADKEDPEKLSRVMGVVYRLIMLTSLLGAVICLVMSPFLSQWTFGDRSHTVGFMVLSLSVALTVGGTGLLAVLQGMGEVKRLSKASLAGGLAGLLFGVPLYWLFGTGGIVPAMVILALAMFLFYYVSCRNAGVLRGGDMKRGSRGTEIARRLISLGLILMIGGLVGAMTNYLINIFVRAYGSEEMVGLFQAANSITNQYVGIVFSALAMDYFPRLSAVVADKGGMREVVNRQSEIVILVMTPLVLLLMATAPVLIRILLTDSYLVITPLMRWLGLGVLLQAVSFPMSYIFLAKDNRKAYVWLEVVLSNVLWIACSMGFFYMFSLVGLGVSLAVRTAIDVAVTYSVCRTTYGFGYSRTTLIHLAVCIILGAAGFCACFMPGAAGYVTIGAITLGSMAYSLVYLRRGIRES